MSPILPTNSNFPSTLKEGQIAARILSGLENLNLTTSSQTIKAHVIKVSQNGTIAFSVNDRSIEAKVTSQLAPTLRIGAPVMLTLNSNSTDLRVQIIEQTPKIASTTKNRFTSEKTFSLPLLRQGLVVEANFITKPSTTRIKQNTSGNPQPNAKQLPFLSNILPASPKQDENFGNSVQSPRLNISKKDSKFHPPLINFSKERNSKRSISPSLLSIENRPSKTNTKTDFNSIGKPASSQNAENSNRNLSKVSLPPNTQTIPQTNAPNFRYNSKNGIMHVVNVSKMTRQRRKSFPLVFSQPELIKNTEKNNISSTQFPPQRTHEENAKNKTSPGTNDPIPNSLNHINPAVNGKHPTDHRAIKHAITTFLEQKQSKPDSILHRGVNRNIDTGNKNVDVRIIKLLSPNSSSHPTTISNKNTVVTGTVIGKTLHGEVVLDTPEKLVTLSGTTDFPRDTKILIEPLSVGTNKNIIPEKLTIAQLTNGWARLETFITDLNIKSPDNGINFTSNQIGKPNLKLTATMALFISAIRMGNPNLWLGQENKNIINRSQPGLIRGLDEDFFLMQRASEPSDSGWRAFFFPMLSDEQLSQIQLFIHQDKNSSDKDKNSSRKTRFIVNLKLDNIGELQIDGRVNSVMVDLLVQTIKPLPLKLKKGMRDVFKNTLERTEIDGNIVFKVRKMLDPLPINQLNGFSETSPSITDI